MSARKFAKRTMIAGLMKFARESSVSLVAELVQIASQHNLVRITNA